MVSGHSEIGRIIRGSHGTPVLHVSPLWYNLVAPDPSSWLGLWKGLGTRLPMLQETCCHNVVTIVEGLLYWV